MPITQDTTDTESKDGSRIDLSEVQSNVLRGYRYNESLGHVAYVFVGFESASAARAFLREASAITTSCSDYDELVLEAQAPPWSEQSPNPAFDRFVWNVGLTYDGMRVLEPSLAPPRDHARDDDEDFGPFTAHTAFAHGPRQPGRAKALGDVGESSPDQWDKTYQRTDLHAVLSLSAWTSEGIERALAEARRLLRREGVYPVGGEQAVGRPDGKEHFGYVDGIGQPFVEGSGLKAYPGEGTPTEKGWRGVPPGEFVMGYPTVVDELATLGTDDPPKAKPIPQLLENGSFFVLRKLEENVEAFRAWIHESAEAAGMSKKRFAASVVGRWQSGAPLALSPDKDDPTLINYPEKVNDFRYASDASGLRTPFGSHIRRGNPRDDPTGPSPLQTSQRRLIRRAIPYGSYLPEEGEMSKSAADAKGLREEDASRGVLFGVINANISNQFEFVQANWINSTLSSTELTFERDKDPLLGAHDGSGKFTIPRAEGPHFVWDLPRFVTVRGSAYFFMPGLSALRRLAD